METETITGIDLEKEYYRTLLAARLAASIFILLSAVWCWFKYNQLDKGLQIFENMVTGGVEAMPALTKFVLGHGDTLAGLAGLAGFGSIGWMWMGGHSIARVIYAGTIGVICCLLFGYLFDAAVWTPLTTIITRFNG